MRAALLLREGRGMGETTVYIIRHGECDGNRDKRIRGCVDFPLNENGVKQARALAARLKGAGISAVVTSPLARALETARILGEAVGAEPVVKEGFRNICFGEWENRLQSDIMRELPEAWRTWTTRPEELRVAGAESLFDVRERSLRELENTVAEYEGRTIALVSHRALIKPMLAGALGVAPPFFWRLHLDNAAYGVLSHTPARGFTLRALNITEHLKDLKIADDFDSM